MRSRSSFVHSRSRHFESPRGLAHSRTFSRSLATRKGERVDFAIAPVHIAAMSFDISHILDKWEYHPGQVVVRKFIGRDGQEKIQLRVDLGLLQMNAEGRPDGKRPF